MRYNEIISYLTESLEDKININKDKFLNDNRFKNIKDKEEIFNLIVNSDPTKNKAYLPWLISKGISNWTNKDDNLFKEDLPITRDTLQRYNDLKQGNKLKNEHKDINKFKDETELWKTLRDDYQDIDTSSKKEIKKNIEQEFYDNKEATLVHNDSKYKIVIPHSQKASCYFGINTKWCTAADKNNMFSNYNDKGNLYIILIKANNERYQFHIETGSFMDEMDDEIDLEEFSEDYPDLFDILFPTDKEQIELVKQDVYAIEYIKNPSEAVKLEAVKRNGYVIEYIKNPSEAVKLEAVRQNGLAIQFIKNPNEELKLEAVIQNGRAIEYIKSHSEAVQLESVRNNPYAIEYIKNPSEAVQIEAVKRNGRVIEYIEKPSEKVQQYIIDNHHNYIEYIKNISPKMKEYAKSKGIDI